MTIKGASFTIAVASMLTCERVISVKLFEVWLINDLTRLDSFDSIVGNLIIACLLEVANDSLSALSFEFLLMSILRMFFVIMGDDWRDAFLRSPRWMMELSAPFDGEHI